MKITAWLLLIVFGLIVTSILFSGCKARKVALVKSDSISTSQEATKTHIEQTQVDKSKSSEVTVTTSTDSSETTTVITPVEGKPIVVNKDGSFSGEAKSVVNTTKKKSNQQQQQQKTVDNNIQTTSAKDSSSNKKAEVHVQKKSKQVESKPNNGWIIYVAIGILILFVGVILYFKFRSKI
jgi:FtsZ-interacting cell division protein ZipA